MRHPPVLIIDFLNLHAAHFDVRTRKFYENTKGPKCSPDRRPESIGVVTTTTAGLVAD